MGPQCCVCSWCVRRTSTTNTCATSLCSVPTSKSISGTGWGRQGDRRTGPMRNKFYITRNTRRRKIFTINSYCTTRGNHLVSIITIPIKHITCCGGCWRHRTTVRIICDRVHSTRFCWQSPSWNYLIALRKCTNLTPPIFIAIKITIISTT